jgi:methionyl-tRNA formyltransferase
MNKERTTGVSVIEASKKSFDKGHIIIQKEIELKDDFRFKELSEILSQLGGEEILKFLRNYEKSLSEKKPQIIDPNNKNQFAPLVTERNFVYLDFQTKTSEELLALYRAFYGSQLEPFTNINLKGEVRQLFFQNLSLSLPSHNELLKSVEHIASSGGLYWDMKLDNDSFFIKSVNGWLVSRNIKINRKNYMPVSEFVEQIMKNQRFNKSKNGLAFMTLKL